MAWSVVNTADGARRAGFRQVRPPSVRAGFHQVRPRPPHPSNWRIVRPPSARAGFSQVTDRTNPAARAYATQRLQALVAQGILPRWLPEWSHDPAAAWRGVSQMVYGQHPAAASVQPPGQVIAPPPGTDFSPIDEMLKNALAAAAARRNAQYMN